MIILAFVVTIVTGVIGAAVGDGMNFLELGPILSIATMGSFIMYEVRKRKE
ncbi:MAG: hypothetical protein ACLFPS_08135 [Clostridia bacterium]